MGVDWLGKGGAVMRCEKCGKEISSLLVDIFKHDGSDSEQELALTECEEDAAYIDTDQNWVGYELSEEEMLDTILCPHCREFPFKNTEIQVYDIVRVVCFKEAQGWPNA